MKIADSIRLIVAGLAVAAWLTPSYAAPETITITEEGGATPESEDVAVQDSFTRIGSDARGRFAEKLYVQREFSDGTGSNVTTVAAVRFLDLNERIGEGRKIVHAKLLLECTNASGPKPIEAIAYPFLEDWDYNRFMHNLRLHDTKDRAWNTASPEINLTPASTTADDKGVYDFAERHDTTPILANGVRPGTDVNTIAESMDAEFDVTNIVKLWYDGTLPNFGLAIVAPNPGTYMRFWATNGEGNGPRLVIEVE